MGSSLSAMAASASQSLLSERRNTTKGYELHRNEVTHKIFGADAGVALFRKLVHHVQVEGEVLHFVLFLFAVVGFMLVIYRTVLRLLVLGVLLRFLFTAARTATATAVVE